MTESNSSSALEDIRQIRVLIDQASDALERAEADGDLTRELTSSLGGQLDAVRDSLSTDNLLDSANALIEVCRTVDTSAAFGE